MFEIKRDLKLEIGFECVATAVGKFYKQKNTQTTNNSSNRQQPTNQPASHSKPQKCKRNNVLITKISKKQKKKYDGIRLSLI